MAGYDDPTVSFGDDAAGHPTPWYRKPPLLAGWVILVLILLALITWGVITLFSGNSGPTFPQAPSSTTTVSSTTTTTSTSASSTTSTTTPTTTTASEPPAEQPPADTGETEAPETTSKTHRRPHIPSTITLPEVPQLPNLPTEITLPDLP
ncbi:hypothetical protein [Mycobacterium sp. 1274756.6]|uniref:hypothetical protein n=1 Tax=Mycobacterium sp. 1274756.6 TaxID=1834076 RepID=UPI0007FC7E97|nr:hypothetical protein [Mycobacterium sp. 1274756.6]OBJ69072.1 hypothetical protein A5643_12620 [Mycobacterium sp. 1274756.6]